MLVSLRLLEAHLLCSKRWMVVIVLSQGSSQPGSHSALHCIKSLYSISALHIPFLIHPTTHNHYKLLYAFLQSDCTMLLIHGIPAKAFRSLGHDTTEPESKSTSTTNLTPGESSQGAESWIDIDEEPIKLLKSECSTPASASSDDQESISHTEMRCNTPTADPASRSTTFAKDSHTLDTVTFPSHAVHLLPSKPNGTWRTQVSYAVTNPTESASTLRETLEQHAHELNVPTLVCNLKQVIEDRKDDYGGRLNQALIDYDLVEIHDRIRGLVTVPSMPSMRELVHAVDTVTEIAQSLRKRRSESEPLEQYRDDKYIFAEIVGRKAQRALIEQGICKEWQLQCEGHVQLQHAMQAALMHTFTRIQQSYAGVPLFRAQPQWTAKREAKVWRLELDVGVVGVEVGPATDRSLIELGSIDTCFDLPESCGCATLKDVDRQVQGVEDEWQLLEA